MSNTCYWAQICAQSKIGPSELAHFWECTGVMNPVKNVRVQLSLIFARKANGPKGGWDFVPPSVSNLPPKEQSGSSILSCQTACIECVRVVEGWANHTPHTAVNPDGNNNCLLLRQFSGNINEQWTRSKLAGLNFTQKRVKEGVSKMDTPVPKVALHDLSWTPAGSTIRQIWRRGHQFSDPFLLK